KKLRAVGRRVKVRRQMFGAPCDDISQLDKVAADRHVQLFQERAADGAGRNAGGGLSSGGALENVSRVGAVVLQHSGEVCVSRARTRHGSLSQTRVGRLVRK